MSDWLPGVVAGEMPAPFEPEALKAQAVAAPTNIMYAMGREKPAHPEADVCDDPACCKAHSTDEALRENWGEGLRGEHGPTILAAGRSTDGEYMSYGGEVIQADFHSSSAGRTEDSAAIWQAEPYLVSVESPETADDVPNYVSSVTVSRRTCTRRCSPPTRAEFGEDPAFWLGAAVHDASGRVESVDIGGAQVPGTELRTLFELRSTAFALDYTAAPSSPSRASGHGVGMSQYGANVMAQDGADYREMYPLLPGRN